MSERMRAYRQRMEEKGLVQVRIWIEKEDEEFVKFIGKFCREEGRQKKPKQRYGRPATQRQIQFAQKIASENGLPEPKHLYDYHISLGAWIWRYKGGSGF
jgi:hypothetical protein